MSCPPGVHTHPIEEICCPRCNALLRLMPPGEIRCDGCGCHVVAEWYRGALALKTVDGRPR